MRGWGEWRWKVRIFEFYEYMLVCISGSWMFMQEYWARFGLTNSLGQLQTPSLLAQPLLSHIRHHRVHSGRLSLRRRPFNEAPNGRTRRGFRLGGAVAVG